MNIRLTYIILLCMGAIILSSCNNDIFIKPEPEAPEVPEEWTIRIYGNGSHTIGHYFHVDQTQFESISISFLNTDFDVWIESEENGTTTEYTATNFIGLSSEELTTTNIRGEAKGPYTMFEFRWDSFNGEMTLYEVANWGNAPENIAIEVKYPDYVEKGLIIIDPGCDPPATYRVCSIEYPDMSGLSVKPYSYSEDITTIKNNGPDVYNFTLIPAEWINGFIVFSFPLPGAASLTDDEVSVNIPFYSPEFDNEKPDPEKWFNWKYVTYSSGIVTFKPTEPAMTTPYNYEIPPYSTRSFSADIFRYDINAYANLILENIETSEHIEIPGTVRVLQAYDCKIHVTEK